MRKCLKYVETRGKIHPGLHFYLAFPKVYPLLCRHGFQELLGAFPHVSRHTFRQFLYVFLEAVCFCLLRLKIGYRTENLKTLSGSSTDYDLPNHTIYGQTQIGATVPLRAQKTIGRFLWISSTGVVVNLPTMES
jgi:hypothetical protein